ncbi:MAG: FAD-dependent oxidoreductase [Deltaproteobacteria bacterium]|nr:FAD-dependent oxidoreductase [Deltaproteobacteria bacterium]
MSDLEKLFTPIRIGSMELANRIAMAPMTVDYANDDETPSDRQIAYYAERAKGGVGLIGLEVTTVDPKHRYQQHSLGLHDDGLIAGHKALVEAVHAHGTKVQPQISHPGPESLAPFYEQLQPMGPSVIRTETTKQACREMSVEEIEGIIELYGDAARRAREAGYDGIELHAAHSYMMLGSFLSPLRNFRTDEYAGHSFEGRAKLLLQVVGNIRSKVGGDFPITVRLSGFERESGGREINDTQRLAPMLVAAGVDCFHVSGGVGDSNITQIITGPEYDPGFNLAAATALKQVVDVPVMVVGQNMDPSFVAAILEREQADIIAMGRALLADPELPNKARTGRLGEINRCILCQDCIDAMTSVGQGTACAVNPRCGREREYPAGRTEGKSEPEKKVLVIGGGPGGLEAARVACERGHRVTLLEKQTELGGAFRTASTLFPHNRLFLDYLVGRVRALPVELRLGEEASEAKIREIAPDVIIVATGGRAQAPDLAGQDGGNVIRGDEVHALIERASGGESGDALPTSPVAVVGGNLMGLELAEWLARQGCRVHVIEPTRRLATPAGKKRRGDHAKRLDALGVAVNTGVPVQGIDEEGVHLDLGDGKSSVVKASTVILVGERVADETFFERVRSLAPEVHAIGDCTGFGLSKKAVAEATQVAYEV